jgi:hypothetical protein
MTCHRIECVETEKALKERIKELEANVWYLKGVRDENLAASQAREQVLRDALVEVCRTHGIHHEALDKQSDDSALDARLVAERERVAQMVLNGAFLHTEAPVAIWAREVADAIRGMK